MQYRGFMQFYFLILSAFIWTLHFLYLQFWYRLIPSPRSIPSCGQSDRRTQHTRTWESRPSIAWRSSSKCWTGRPPKSFCGHRDAWTSVRSDGRASPGSYRYPCTWPRYTGDSSSWDGGAWASGESDLGRLPASPCAWLPRGSSCASSCPGLCSRRSPSRPCGCTR